MLKALGGFASSGGGVGAVTYKGTWDASTNTPTLASGTGTQGDYYVVNVAGSTNLDGIADWQIGDWAIFNGSVWQKVDNTDAVSSVNGYVGTVVLTNTDVNAAAIGANSDLTSLDGLTGGVETPTYVQMGNGAAVTLAAGKLWYNPDTGAWNLGMGGGNITQQVGEEIFVYGKASAAITEGQVIARTGVVGASGAITFAPAPLNTTNQDLILGVATENIALGDFGRVTYFGVVRGINTNAFSDGDALYYDPTVVGGLTVTKPTGLVLKLEVATVISAGVAGSIQVRLGSSSTFGSTDSNVEFAGLANNDVIVYDSGTNLWVNSPNITLSNITADNVTVTANLYANLATSNTAAMPDPSLPLNPEGYVEIVVNGSTKKVPYYGV